MKKNIDVSMIIRTVLLVLALINQALLMAGHSPLPIEDEQITELITIGFTIATALWNWWKNNNITDNAKIAQQIKNGLDKGTVGYKAATDLAKKA